MKIEPWTFHLQNEFCLPEYFSLLLTYIQNWMVGHTKFS